MPSLPGVISPSGESGTDAAQVQSLLVQSLLDLTSLGLRNA